MPRDSVSSRVKEVPTCSSTSAQSPDRVSSRSRKAIRWSSRWFRDRRGLKPQTSPKPETTRYRESRGTEAAEVAERPRNLPGSFFSLWFLLFSVVSASLPPLCLAVPGALSLPFLPGNKRRISRRTDGRDLEGLSLVRSGEYSCRASNGSSRRPHQLPPPSQGESFTRQIRTCLPG